MQWNLIKLHAVLTKQAEIICVWNISEKKLNF